MAGNFRKQDSARDGQKIRVDGAPDKSSYDVGGDHPVNGGKFGGGPTDLSHSLKGDKASMDYQKK